MLVLSLFPGCSAERCGGRSEDSLQRRPIRPAEPTVGLAHHHFVKIAQGTIDGMDAEVSHVGRLPFSVPAGLTSRSDLAPC